MGGSSTPPPPPVLQEKAKDDSDMLNFLRQQNIQNLDNQRAAREAEQRALYSASQNAARQAGAAGAQAAQQMVGLQNQYQQAKDVEELSKFQKAMSKAGSAVTGGPYDPVIARQEQMQNIAPGLGTVIPMLPANMQQTASMINPVNLLSKDGNKQSPSVKFGGS